MGPNNQMNSMYKSPMGQTGHKSSFLALIILLAIAIIVAVLGFGRIKTIKQEQAEADMMRAQKAGMHPPAARQESSADVYADIDAALNSDYASGTSQLDAQFGN